ncbi:hypothetical protein SKAU_G00251220 [Synaphobranchus kaupii]|uniref:Uncharacterized protein n=1 Tax=Synaphobranchus kaupii TaxID=118154 RepID=A0A9Q1F2V2_SYNKA|nr:hypothetical protein SKAU_G00251220 [Synaphobranchus kaupii]
MDPLEVPGEAELAGVCSRSNRQEARFVCEQGGRAWDRYYQHRNRVSSLGAIAEQGFAEHWGVRAPRGERRSVITRLLRSGEPAQLGVQSTASNSESLPRPSPAAPLPPPHPTPAFARGPGRAGALMTAERSVADLPWPAQRTV